MVFPFQDLLRDLQLFHTLPLNLYCIFDLIYTEPA
jgi:hypothetical protein